MRHSGYQLADDPAPGALEKIAVDPMWPFFAIIFGGAWISWPWFVLNGFAVGSPTRYRELAITIGGFLATGVAVLVLVRGADAGWFPSWSFPYIGIGIVVIKLAVTYSLHVLQAKTFEIYTYYGGQVSSGVIVVVGAFMITTRVASRVREVAPLLVLWLS